MSVVHFYTWTIIASALASIALSLVGAQLASRNQSMQTMVVSQSSSLGVVLGLAFCLLDGHEDLLHWMMPLFFGMAFSVVVYIYCNRGRKVMKASRNTYYVGLFAVFASLTHMVTSLVPSLESHMASSYFGDLTLASDKEAISIGIVAFFVIIFVTRFWNAITAISFDRAMFGENLGGKSREKTDLIFISLSLGIIVLCIQFLGLLFTLSALFLPSLIVSDVPVRLKTLAWYLVTIAALGALTGFFLSLLHGKIPTSPAITLSLVLFGFLFRLILKQKMREE